jgi:acetolactate synthase-1/2/3 large subunit
MVRQWQEILYEKRYSQTDMGNNPDLVKIAEAFGALGRRITSLDDVKPALQEALQIKDRPILLDFAVCKEENVFPFVPPGQALNEMLID